MGINIKQVGLEVAGQVVRKYDKDADVTSLVVDQAQAQEMYDSLGTVLQLFKSQVGQPLASTPKVSGAYAFEAPKVDVR